MAERVRYENDPDGTYVPPESTVAIHDSTLGYPVSVAARDAYETTMRRDLQRRAEWGKSDA